MPYGDISQISGTDAVAFNHIISDPKLLNAAMRGRYILALLLGLPNAGGYRAGELRRDFSFDKLEKDSGAQIELPFFSGQSTPRPLTYATASNVTPTNVTAKPYNVVLPWYEVVDNVDVPGVYMRRAGNDKGKIENVMKMFGTQLVEGYLQMMHNGLMWTALPSSSNFGGLRALISDGVSPGEAAYAQYGTGVGVLDRSAVGNEGFRSLVVKNAGAFSRIKLASWQQTLRDRGGMASIGIMNSADHAALQVQYSEKSLIRTPYDDLISKIGAPYFQDNGTLFIPDSVLPSGTLLLIDPEDFFFRGKAYDAMPDKPKVLEGETSWVHLQNNEDLWRAKIIYSFQTGIKPNSIYRQGKIEGLTF